MTDDLDHQIKQLSRKLGEIAFKDVQQAMATSLNKTATHVKGRTVRGVSKETGIKQKILRKRVFISRANKQKQRAKITTYSQGVPIIVLLSPGQRKPNRRRKGLRLGKRFYKSAFINNVRGNPQALKRVGESRYPIEVLRIDIEKIADRIQKKVATRAMDGFYRRTLANDLKFRLQKHSV